MKRIIALASVALAAASSAFAVSATYMVYSYTATIGSTTSVSDGLGGTLTFDAGDTITGQVYLKTGITGSSGGWAYSGEVANYASSVALFTFNHEDISIVGSGLGSSSVNDNRRFTASASSDRQDVFIATSGSTYTPTAFGGGVDSLQLALITNFLPPGSPGLDAVTGLSYPTSVNVGKFGQMHTLTLGFSSASDLVANVQSVSVSYASAIPEPSTYAAFAGVGVLALAVWRRRQAR